jgi:hypothetical protein
MSNARIFTAEELLQRHGIDYVATSKNKYTTKCPKCGGYLNVELKRGGVLWGCVDCKQGGAEKFEQRETSSELGPIKAVYDYTDEQGNRLFQALRFEPLNGPKQFRQRTGPDQEKWSIKGVRIVPFMLPELLEDIASGRGVFVVEGEKDVLTLRERGIPATCNPMGAGKWWKEFNKIFRDADVVICGDNDHPGRDHIALVARNLHSVVRRIRVLDLKQFWPEIEESDDISDWFEAGHNAGELRRIVDGVPDWQPSGAEQEEKPKINSGRASSKVRHEKVERSEGAALLEQVSSFLSRFIAYPSDHAQIAHVLWIAHSHLMDAWDSTPRIAFLSPEPASGKTRSLEVSELLVPDPVAAVNVTPAYLFRKVGGEDGPPTILFDEIDAVCGPKAKENEELRALLNSGHRRGAVAGRCVTRGRIVETEEIPSYGAVALAGLGWLPDTILSRSVIVRMCRRAPDEKVEPFRRRVHAPIGEALRRRLAGWAATVLKEATEARPDMPEGVEDRAADVWEPLFAVADIAGRQWPELARKAAVALVAAAREVEPSLNIRLLADLRTVFGDEEALSTKKILAELYLIEDAPWNDLKGKQLSDAQLARRLRQYGVKSRVIRIGNATPRGYTREDLYDVWRRYLPPTFDKPATSTTPATSQSFQSDNIAPEEFEAATHASEPQHGGPLHVAPVADSDEACCGSVDARNADETGIVAPVAPVAPAAGNGGEPGSSSSRARFKYYCHCGGAGAFGYSNENGTLDWFCAAHRRGQSWADVHLSPDELLVDPD